MKANAPLPAGQRPQLFILHGDLTQLQADAIVYPTSTAQEDDGHLAAAMQRPDLGFRQVYTDAPCPARQPIEAPGEAYWVSLEEHGRAQGPYGVVVTATVEAAPEARPTVEIIRAAARRGLEVALSALGGVHERLLLREAFTQDMERALRPVVQRWRLKDSARQALLDVRDHTLDRVERWPRDAALEQRRMRVAFPALGTGAGSGGGADHASALALAEAQLAGIVDALAALDPALRARVDVVLVAYNEQTLHRFFKARRDLLGRNWRFDEAAQTHLPVAEVEVAGAGAPQHLPWLQWPADPRTVGPMTAALADAISRGECVLFVGSGLSSGVGMKSWQHLIEALLDDLQELADARGLTMPTLEHATTEDYLDIAQWHASSRAQTGAPSHPHYVNRFFGPEATATLPLSIAHFLLMGLPFRHFITTNYDDLIERTLDAVRRPNARIVRDQDVPRTGRSDEVSVVKFHGHAFDVDDDDRIQAGDTIVLTREEYDTFFHRHPAKALLLEGLLLNHHFFFIGYSLNDPDFRQIQNRVIHMLKGAQRKAFATTLDDHRHWARVQWEDRQLAQIRFHAGSIHARVHAMWCWLDTLSELVAGAPTTFLTDQGPGEGPLAPVHEVLRRLGQRAEVAWEQRHDLDAEQRVILETILDLLSRLGWRPRDPERSWVALWRALADLPGQAPGDQLRLLRKALASADSSEVIASLREALAPLEARDAPTF